MFILYRSRQAAERVEAKLGERLMERDRIARELHDTLLQGFQMLVLRFQVIADSIPEHEPARDMLEKTLTRADEIILEGRERVRDLRAESGPGEDLARSLAELGHELRREFATEFQFVVEGNPRPIRPVVRDEIEMIAREAITNAFGTRRRRALNAWSDSRRGIWCFCAAITGSASIHSFCLAGEGPGTGA